jgi:hypothetical protein
MRYPWYAYLILTVSAAVVGGIGGWVMWTLHPAAGAVWVGTTLAIALGFGLAQLRNQ